MEGIMPLGERCGFCERLLDDGEETHPLYVGEPPKPKPRTARGFAKTDRQVIGREFEDIQILDYAVDEIAAILDALERSRELDVDVKRAVEEVRAAGTGEVMALAEATIDNSKVGASIAISEPRMTDPDPDLEVCRFCLEGMTEGSDNE